MNEFARQQFNQAKGTRPRVTCRCGQTMPLRFAYKCLYCGEYFCERCAEEHFGKNKEEYQKEKLLEAER